MEENLDFRNQKGEKNEKKIDFIDNNVEQEQYLEFRTKNKEKGNDLIKISQDIGNLESKVMGNNSGKELLALKKNIQGTGGLASMKPDDLKIFSESGINKNANDISNIAKKIFSPFFLNRAGIS